MKFPNGHECKHTKCSKGPTCVIFLKCRGFNDVKYDIPVCLAYHKCHEGHEGHEGQEGHEGHEGHGGHEDHES